MNLTEIRARGLHQATNRHNEHSPPPAPAPINLSPCQPRQGSFYIIPNMAEEDDFELPVEAMEMIVKGAPKYIMIRGQPCRVVSSRLKKKATNKGNDRVELKGRHLLTSKLYEDTVRGDTKVPVIKVDFTEYDLMDVDVGSGNVSLLDEEGECKEDASLAKENDEWDDVAKEVIRRFEEEEEDLRVVVFSCFLFDKVIEVKGGEAK